MRRATRILFSLVNLGHLQAGQSGAGPWPAGGLSGRLSAPPSKTAGGLRARRSARRCPTMSLEISDIKAEPWLVSPVQVLFWKIGCPSKPTPAELGGRRLTVPLQNSRS